MLRLGDVQWPTPAVSRAAPLGLEPGPSAEWGADVCPQCFGAGVLRVDAAPGDPAFGTLRPCDHPECKRRESGEIAMLWRLSGFKADAANPPTLENFDPHDDAAAAMLAAALDFLDDPRRWFVLYGRAKDKGFSAGHAGAGKSHLAEALFREFMRRGSSCMFVRAHELFEYLGARWREVGDDTDYDRRMAKVLRQRVLIIDEFGREPDTDAVARLRYKVIESRWRAAIYGDGPAAESNGGATMLISNLHPDAWADQTVASRAMDSRFRPVEATDVDYRRLGR